MRRVFKYFVFTFIVFTALASCTEKQKEQKVFNTDKIKEPLINVNKQLVKDENKDIENYINRYGWKMTETGTGLRYSIYKKGNGVQPKKGDYATIKYKVSLINGILCYDSNKEGPKEFLTGKAEVENGLEEGIMLMHVGDKAKLIIPSHLAFGLLGDDNKIPKRATLVYDIELINVK